MPYPGKYIETNLIVSDVKEKQPLPMNLDINNLGTNDLKNIYSVFSVYNLEGQTLVSSQSQSISIKSKESSTLTTMLNPNTLAPAIYTLESETFYDGETKKNQAIFRVGTLHIDILNFTKQIKSGSIQKFYIYAESKWNDPVEDVYATIVLSNLTGEKIIEARTRGYTFNSFDKIKIESFLDTTNMEPGEYIIEITLNYEDKISSKKSTILITSEPKKEKPFNISFEFINTTNIAIILLVIIVLLLLVFDLILLKKRGKNNETE